MANQKSDYRTTLEILNGLYSPSQFYDKLNKVFANTEDLQLRKLIGPALKVLQTAHSVLVAKKAASQKTSIAYQTEPYNALVVYCRAQLANEKPTWQVLAERHGWRPPEGK